MCEKDRQCKICGKKTDFIGIRERRAYKEFCSNECLYKYRSNEQNGEKNNVHKIEGEKRNEWKNKISTKLKERIERGYFTPCVTNSWCHSRIKTIIQGETIKHRSSWEAFFHIKNPDLQYEKIRIPYVYENTKHVYIVDFVDINNKIIYEIKPRSEKTKLKNICKRKYAKNWAEDKDYIYKIIDDDWFYENYDEKLLYDQPYKEKLLKNLKQFNENKKN